LKRPPKIIPNLIIALILASNGLKSQDLLYSGPNYGFNVSLNLALGTHINRLGVNLHFYYLSGQFQANTELRTYYNFRNLGPKLPYPEIVLSQGLVFGYGGKTNLYNPFLSAISNQTIYRNSIAYAYNLWFNRIGTTQQTGNVAFIFDGAGIIAENDILARPTLDRFRTGAFLLQYQYADILQAGVNCSIWTGQFGNKKEIFLIKAFYNNCYMDTTGGRFISYAHGLLSAQVKYNVGYGQNVQLNAGIDAEQVRNAIQNKLIHNMRFLPENATRTKNCHLPMIDQHGNLFLYSEGQLIRKPRVYLNAFANAGIFY
jgi:hypothetical protein